MTNRKQEKSERVRGSLGARLTKLQARNKLNDHKSRSIESKIHHKGRWYQMGHGLHTELHLSSRRIQCP